MATSAQLRAARALLALSQPEVARAAGVSSMTVKRAEGSGRPAASAEAMAAIRRVLEDVGVEFIDGDRPGVRWRGWKWYVATCGVGGLPRDQRVYPDFESALAAATQLKSTLRPPDRPFAHFPAEATDAQRTAFRKLGVLTDRP